MNRDVGGVFTGIVKIGGARGNDSTSLLDELASRSVGGDERWGLVHGASSMMEDICIAAGIEPRYVISPSGYRSRFVSESDQELFLAACCRFSMELVERLGSRGCWGHPLYPHIESVARARRKDVLRSVEGGRRRILRGNYSGSITGCSVEPLLETWARGALPVLPPLAEDEETGCPLNVDGDRMAAAVAAALDADVLVILTNVPGLLEDPSDSRSRIERGSLAEWSRLEALAEGNMKRKLLAAREALEGGVEQVVLSDSRVPHPLKLALSGGGTSLCR